MKSLGNVYFDSLTFFRLNTPRTSIFGESLCDCFVYCVEINVMQFEDQGLAGLEIYESKHAVYMTAEELVICKLSGHFDEPKKFWESKYTYLRG